MRYIPVLLLLASMALPAADLSGNWPGTLETARGADSHNLTLSQSGGAITGTITFLNRKSDIQNVKLEGQRLTFEITMSGANPWVLAYDLQISGDEITGALSAKQGPFPGGKVRFKRAK
jgi:hypothetical protein